MSTFPRIGATDEAFPRVLRYCEQCQGETVHEIHSGTGIIMCIPCLERVLNYELDRD